MAISKDQITQMQEALKLLAAFVPPAVKPYIDDVTTDAPLGVAAYFQIKEALAKMPPRAQRTAVNVFEAFGVTVGMPLHTIAELFDAIEAQVAKKPAPLA
jgi:hypothetical protein